MRQNILSSAKDLIKILIVAALVIPIISVFAAWQEPGQSPPGGNAPAPLNVSSTAQIKEGGLWLNIGGASTGLIVDKGKVGIGTTNPSNTLNVVGGGIDITGSPGSNDDGWRFATDGGVTDDTLFFQDISRGTTPLVIRGISGNVGIGTTGPDRPLTVQGTGANHELLSFKDNAGATKWFWNMYGSAGLNLAEAGVADGRLFIKYGGYVGIGTTEPVQRLDVNGGIKVANANNCIDGTIRYNGDFEGCKGGKWVSLTGVTTGPSTGPSQEEECRRAGGSWQTNQQICYFSGSSCPAGWAPNANYSSTASKTCSGTSSYCKDNECTTGSHYRLNKSRETCQYFKDDGTMRCGGQWATCYASQTEIGCFKQ